jgi:hypothetical protein
VISSAELLSNFEHCQRWGHWSQSWERHRMRPLEMLHSAVRQALIEDCKDPGESAGEIVMTLAADRGLDISLSHNLYRCGINHACIADLIVTRLRQDGGRWIVPCSDERWTTSALVSPEGTHLRRFLAVTYWSEDREFFEKHSWYSLGEIAHYELPMQLVIAVLGPVNGGRRHGHWSKAIMHPQRSELRFRLRRRAKVEGFKETWLPIWREEHDEISREKWLASMAMDEVLQQSLFVLDIPVPERPRLIQMRDMAARQLERLQKIRRLPEKQLSTCHNPLHPCPFRACCWSDPGSGPEEGGYDSTRAAEVPEPHGTHSLPA